MHRLFSNRPISKSVLAAPSVASASLRSIAAVALLTVASAGLVGCSALSGGDDDRSSDTRGVNVPSGSRLVADGRGNLSWTATSDGTVYLYDSTDRRLVTRHEIEQGDRVRVTPGENRVTVDDDVVFDNDLTSDHTHRLYFDSERDGDNRSDNREGRSNRDDLPSGADLIGRGQERDITFTASRDGRVYLYDDEDREVVASTAIRDGERFSLSPERGRATINGRAVFDDADIDRDDTYAVYFARD